MRSSATGQKPNRRRPAIERLENRCLLSTVANFSWTIPPLYGTDSNGNGIIDLPNSSAYVNPAGYTVTFDASASTSTATITNYAWTLKGGVMAAPWTFTGQTPVIENLQQGTYNVTLSTTDSTGATGTSSQIIDVRDYLVVGLGDSYASGEGNPEIPSTNPQDVKWADGVTPAMTQENFEAHRSSAAYSSQAALGLEQSDPHSAVTYLNLAISGATIPNGMLGPTTGATNSAYILPAEIPELKSIVGSRQIDALTLSIGGNDYGFVSLLGELLQQNLSTLPSNSQIEAQRDQALAALPAEFNQLATALQGLNISHIYITAYPDLTQVAPGDYQTFGTDVLSSDGFKGITPGEAQFASQQLLAPLNTAIQRAAQAHGWTFVNGYLTDFQSHGYAATDPWFVTMSTALSQQGADTYVVNPLFRVSSGAFHPNRAGLADEAAYVLADFKSDLINPLFDEHYYLTAYPAVAAAVAAQTFGSGFNHYLAYGQYEGYNPSPYWNEHYYLQQNPDVAAAVQAGSISSGFMHYFRYGQYENRPGLMYFNENYYLANNPDVAAAVQAGTISSGFEHYVLYGQYEGRSPIMYFQPALYDANNSDILPYVHGQEFSSDYEQFVEYGQYEGRIASPYYNEQIYLADNPDVAAAVAAHIFPDGFTHWLEYGQYENRRAV